MSRSSRPRVAAIITEYHDMAHADVIVGKLLAGYELHGIATTPRLDVASLYLDQAPANDMDYALSAHYDVPIFDTIGEAIAHAIVVEYRDGLQAAILMFDGPFEGFAVAGRQDRAPFAIRFAVEPGPPFGHFTFPVRQSESLVLNGVAPYPVARTILTSGILEAAMRSRQLGGERIETPELAIAYDPVAEIPDTGVGATPPFTPA